MKKKMEKNWKKKPETEKKITTNDITTPAGQTLFDPLRMLMLHATQRW